MTLIGDYERWYRRRYRGTSSSFRTTAMIAADIASVMVSFGVSFFIVNLYDPLAINFRSFVTYWPYLPAFVFLFASTGIYPGAALAPAEELKRISISVFIVHGGMLLSRVVEHKRFDVISAAFVINAFVSPLMVLMGRSLMRTILKALRACEIPAVIYGAGSLARITADRLLVSKSAGYVPVVFLDTDESLGDEYRGIPILHDFDLGPKLVKQFNIKMAIVAMPGFNNRALTHLVNRSVSAFRYSVFISNFAASNIWMTLRDFGGILGMASSNRLNMYWNLAIKRFLDIAIVIASGFLVLPLYLALALIIKLSSPGPVLYAQQRLGKRGKHFKTYKFRSMVQDAEERLAALLKNDPEARDEWEANHKLKNDPRITAVGKFLRKTSLDELPQLINILRGDMSLVGPRPIVDAEVKKYGENFQRIFQVKPGLTGMWQVSGRSDTDYTERVSLDSYYLQSWSVWLDLWILYKTFGAVMLKRGAY
ncbi:MAG: undecaprenyl-phosphate galactose phosphotransferase WbaP [Treponema sp.]|jgi:Undecaprenyl-phosphate galactose phosphotransferase WbaP|nr:undecaprenyl-phosphate galactose phosphotransferase WbaP [Treponema sp.]